MGDRVSGDFVASGHVQPRPLVTGQLQDYEREAELKIDLQSTQASKGVVIPLLGGRKKSRDQGYRYQAGGTCPDPRQNSKPYRPIEAEDVSTPIPDSAEKRFVQPDLSN